MNIFEELIDELKEENLLEETVFSLNRGGHEPPQFLIAESQANSVLEAAETAKAMSGSTPSAVGGSAVDRSLDLENDIDFIDRPVDERETYRRRAVEEVSSLQMVEHVLSGIEREHMKMSPTTFDDLEVKKALHKYLQVNAPINSDQHSEAESYLFQETQKWFLALSQRDSNISVANVRRFCENSRPVLSSQALIALARFYRNSPYTEAVRGKFDFVITKLFSREIGDAKRKLLFGQVETLGHIKTLYSNWASLAMVDPEDESGTSVSAAVSGFEGFVRESEAAESFDQLITSDFFNRIRLFKERANELFYEPAVTAVAIECNVRIGNRFIDLVQKERELTSDASLEDKYGYSHDTVISHAASKTLLLLDLLRESRESLIDEPVEDAVPTFSKVPKFERAPVDENVSSGLLSVNRWVVLAALATLALTAGVYFWSENAASSQRSVEVAATVDLSGSELTTHLREASVSSETLYGLTQPTWDALSESEKKDLLAKAFQFAKSKGIKKVNFLNSRGRTVAYASESRIEVLSP